MSEKEALIDFAHIYTKRRRGACVIIIRRHKHRDNKEKNSNEKCSLRNRFFFQRDLHEGEKERWLEEKKIFIRSNYILEYTIVYLRIGRVTKSPGRSMPVRDTSLCLYIYFHLLSVFRYKTTANKKKPKEEKERTEREMMIFYASCFSLSLSPSFLFCSYARL